jgi:hypothetical protein
MTQMKGTQERRTQNTGMRRNEIPARSAEPGPSPRFVKNARPNRGKTLAIAERKKSFPASTDAPYAGYADVMYMRMLWKLRKMPGR